MFLRAIGLVVDGYEAMPRQYSFDRLPSIFFGWGQIFAHSLDYTKNYPSRYSLCIERVTYLLNDLPKTSVGFKEKLIDQFMLGATQVFQEETQGLPDA